MKKALYKNEKIIRTRTNKDVNKTYIAVNGVVITPYGVYTGSIIICLEDKAIIYEYTYHLPEIIDCSIGVKNVSEERLKKIVDKAVKVKNYGDFKELEKLVRYSKHIPPLNGPKLKSKKCRELYDLKYLSHNLPPEVFGWKPEYRRLKGRL